jgi:hypothetical protein
MYNTKAMLLQLMEKDDAVIAIDQKTKPGDPAFPVCERPKAMVSIFPRRAADVVYRGSTHFYQFVHGHTRREKASCRTRSNTFQPAKSPLPGHCTLFAARNPTRCVKRTLLVLPRAQFVCRLFRRRRRRRRLDDEGDRGGERAFQVDTVMMTTGRAARTEARWKRGAHCFLVVGKAL